MFKIRKENIKYAMSNHELDEYNNCKNSIIYFIENYTKIKLRKYQYKYIEMYKNNRFHIWVNSRQVGCSHIKLLIYLYELLFNKNINILLVNNKRCNSIEHISIIKEIYKDLPFFLKQGVVHWDKKTIKFENNSSLLTSSRSLNFPINYEIDILDINEMAFIPDNIITKLWKDCVSEILSKENTKISLSSQFNGSNLFYEIVKNADTGKNQFDIMRTYWWEVTERDESWKEEQIKMLGSQKEFRRSYELSIE